MDSTLPLTGERTVPGIPVENYWFRRHEAAYEHVLPYVAGRRVLEVGCGEGYGTALLASRAEVVIGVDYDALTIGHAARTYPQAAFVRGNLAALPVASGAVGVVAALQVIEHVWNHAEFVRECRRALRGDGVLVVTTPNRRTFSPGRETPLNPFHTREFTAAELVDLVRRGGFDVTAVRGLHAGPRLAALDEEHDPSFVQAQLDTPPERWTPALRAAVSSVTTADFDIAEGTARDVDASLDLVLLARTA